MVVALSDIQHKCTYVELANLLSLPILQDPELKELHEKNQYKLYHYYKHGVKNLKQLLDFYKNDVLTCFYNYPRKNYEIP